MESCPVMVVANTRCFIFQMRTVLSALQLSRYFPLEDHLTCMTQPECPLNGFPMRLPGDSFRSHVPSIISCEHVARQDPSGEKSHQ